MKIPFGYTEADIIDIVAGVQQKLARQFAIGYYDEEDIGQFIWEETLILLEDEKYNKGKGTLGALIYTNASNRLKNLHRDKYWRPGGLQNKVAEQSKRSLMQPTYIEKGQDYFVKKEATDLSFLSTMPLHIQNDFYREVYGLKITPNRKRAVREWLREQAGSSF